jgi:hypothetical protein
LASVGIVAKNVILAIDPPNIIDSHCDLQEEGVNYKELPVGEVEGGSIGGSRVLLENPYVAATGCSENIGAQKLVSKSVFAVVVPANGATRYTPDFIGMAMVFGAFTNSDLREGPRYLVEGFGAEVESINFATVGYYPDLVELGHGAAAYGNLVDRRRARYFGERFRGGIVSQWRSFGSMPKTSFRPAATLTGVPVTCWKCWAEAGRAKKAPQIRTRRTLEELFLHDVVISSKGICFRFGACIQMR